jgi:uncharacterized membrane protein
MNARSAITVLCDRDEVRRRWGDPTYRAARLRGAAVTFRDAPGDRGTEVHVDLGGEVRGVARAIRSAQLAKVEDELRRFKRRLETGP